jgi:hypothetical protein
MLEKLLHKYGMPADKAVTQAQLTKIYIYVSSYCYICVLILLHMCPHTAAHVSPYCYMRHTGRALQNWVQVLETTRVGNFSGLPVADERMRAQGVGESFRALLALLAADMLY